MHRRHAAAGFGGDTFSSGTTVHTVQGVVQLHARSMTLILQQWYQGFFVIEKPRKKGSRISLSRLISIYTRAADCSAQLVDKTKTALFAHL